MVQKLQITLIFKLVPDALFASAKIINAFVDTDLKLTTRKVDKSNAHT